MVADISYLLLYDDICYRCETGGLASSSVQVVVREREIWKTTEDRIQLVYIFLLNKLGTHNLFHAIEKVKSEMAHKRGSAHLLM